MGNKKNKKRYFIKAKLKLLKQCARDRRNKKTYSDATASTSTDSTMQSNTSYITLDSVLALTKPNEKTNGGVENTLLNKVDSYGILKTTDSPEFREPVITSQLINNDESDQIELNIDVENQKDDFHPVSGRRIVDINYFLHELQEKGQHNNLFDCKMSYFSLVGEKRVGLISIFKFQCAMCRETCEIHSENSEDTNQINLNVAATTGIISAGIGYSQFEELCASMDIPIFSPNYYSKLQDEVYDKWEKTAKASMEASAKKEREMALAEGQIKNGYPVIDVYVDGSWCARSYGTNYKASSGTAAIIGRRTKEVLYIGVKNKYCMVCARAQNKNVPPKEHACFKNFAGPSTSMESEIIVEGFKQSIAMHGIIYKRLIGDGDASTYAKVLKANPYENQNVTVEKIECRNHILRNFCSKLRGITSDTKYLLQHRKTLTKIRILTMRKVIVKSIKHHNASMTLKNVAISILHNDIVNSMLHAYGDHKMCQSYYCEKKINTTEDLKKIQNSTFAFRINAIVSNVAAKSRSLIEDVDTNTVECFNGVIAKIIAGKRINFAQKRGYQARCSAAVISFNTKSAISSVQRAFHKIPGHNIIKLERKRALKRKYLEDHPVKKRKIVFKHTNSNQQHDYGSGSTAPDMTLTEFEIAKEEFLKYLNKLTADRNAIERATILQRESSDWLEIRKKLITASNFGPICKRKRTTNTANLVKNILYKSNLAHVTAVAHGVENERQALLQLQRQENIEILPCGLFIDPIYPFIGATPDGLVNDNALVEIKCPINAYRIGMGKAIEENKIQILKYNKTTKTCTIKKNSNWFYQIQGQLHITGRQKCVLGIWAGPNEPLYVEYIKKDDDFWYKNIEPKVIQFYMKCLLPEMVDSRHNRGMPIRSLEKENEQPNIEVSGAQLQQPSLSKRTLNIYDF